MILRSTTLHLVLYIYSMESSRGCAQVLILTKRRVREVGTQDSREYMLQATHYCFPASQLRRKVNRANPIAEMCHNQRRELMQISGGQTCHSNSLG